MSNPATRTCLILALAAAVTGAGSAPGRSGPLFERVRVTPISDIREGMNGMALADLDRDGRVDLVATYAEPELKPRTGRGTTLRVFLNHGGFRFREHRITIASRHVTAERFGARAQVPVLADFNRDRFLDILVTRSAPMTGGRLLPRADAIGNTLLVSRNRWDSFSDASSPMGITNERAYNRQPALGDVNQDGWLDIAVGADNIGNANSGLPISRLYIFQPRGPRFEDGAFTDIGGTALVPDFGGFHHDSSRDKAGPDINLSDLDNDTDLDLLQAYHVDCRQPGLPYSPCEYRQGMFVWRNMLAETGRMRFKAITGNGLAEVGKLAYDSRKKTYEPVILGAGLPYVSLADVNNDTRLDVVAVGPSDPGWSPRAEYVGGRFWYNLGDFRFQRATEQTGLAALNWTYRDWYEFFGLPQRAFRRAGRVPRGRTIAQPGLARSSLLDTRPYYADAVFADFDNDGWIDLVVPDRRERGGADLHAVLFMNQRDGRFRPMPLAFSGLDSGAISAEAADIDNDGLVDLIFAADPDNSGTTRSLSQYETRIFRNTGRYGGAKNHWLRMRFTGVSDAALLGARVEVRVSGTSRLLGTRVVAAKQSYKSGSPLEAHIGLGGSTLVDVDVVLPGGERRHFSRLRADQYVSLDLARSTTAPVPLK